jgi:hypothetical protein
MGLRDSMLMLPLEKRFGYDPRLKMLFLDFRHLAIKSERDVQLIKAEVESRVKPFGHRIYAIVNHSGCTIEAAVSESYARMVDALVDSCCLDWLPYGADGLAQRATGVLQSGGAGSRLAAIDGQNGPSHTLWRYTT